MVFGRLKPAAGLTFKVEELKHALDPLIDGLVRGCRSAPDLRFYEPFVALNLRRKILLKAMFGRATPEKVLRPEH